MRGLIRLVIAIGCLSVAFFYMLKFEYRIVKSFLLLRKVKAQGEDIAQGIYVGYNIRADISVLIETLIMFFTAIVVKRKYLNTGIMGALTIVCICILGISSLSLLISMFVSKNVYLTRQGLICFSYYYDATVCRFSWENAEMRGGLPSTLHVYRPNLKVPYTVSFDFDVDIAHKILDGSY